MSGMRQWAAGIVAVGMAVGTPAAGWADTTSDLQQEIAALKQRLQTLEARVAAQQAAPAAPAGGLPAFASGVRLSGFADASYVFNFNEPKSRKNTVRVFDTEANGFQPHAFELVLEKPVSAESPVGFRADVDFGADAEVVGSVTTGLGSTTDEIDLQQAYAEVLWGIGQGLDMKFGKFVTAHGAEVIESKDNWNFSRSFLFGFAIPFTHTGVRFSYPWTSWLTTLFGVSNGWDVVDDNNTGKSVEGGATMSLTPKTSLGVVGMVGPEQTGDNHDTRHLLDVVASYAPSDRLAFKINYDYGHEEDGAIEGQKDTYWSGVAGYARYQWNDWYATAIRGEYFVDADGIRTAQNRDVRLWELTLTNEFKVYRDLISRLEYRHDFASEKIFTDGGGVDRTQDTVSVEMIYPF